MTNLVCRNATAVMQAGDKQGGGHVTQAVTLCVSVNLGWERDLRHST